MCWSVYIILSSDQSLYTGISTDVGRRYAEHEKMSRQGTGPGAKYFYGRRPEKIVYLESGHDRSSASKKESAIKKLSRAQKLKLIASAPRPEGS